MTKLERNHKKKEFVEEWDYFLGRLNFGQSMLDCRAIQFMNEFSFLLKEVIEEERNKVGSDRKYVMITHLEVVGLILFFALMLGLAVQISKLVFEVNI